MLSWLLSKADPQAINIVDPAFYAPIDSKLQNPPSPSLRCSRPTHSSKPFVYTWHLTITCARGVGNLTRWAFPREGNLTFSRLGWGIWTRSVKFNLLSSFLCQTTLLQSNIFLVAKWRSTRKCQRNDVKMRFQQLCTSTCQPMTSCVLCTFPVWPTGNGNHLLCLCNSFAFMGEISPLSYTLIWKGMLSWSSG